LDDGCHIRQGEEKNGNRFRITAGSRFYQNGGEIRHFNLIWKLSATIISKRSVHLQLISVVVQSKGTWYMIISQIMLVNVLILNRILCFMCGAIMRQ